MHQTTISVAVVDAEEGEKFYRDLTAQGMKVRVGMELVPLFVLIESAKPTPFALSKCP